MKLIQLALILSLPLAAACTATTSQVNVRGQLKDRIQISGEWMGRFGAIEEGKAGRMRLLLREGRNTGEASVKFAKTGKPETVKVTELQVKGSRVAGTLDPYRSKGCSCLVRTEFRGLIQGDIMDGTFVSTFEDKRKPVKGNWSMRRAAP
jgi:hypothetical protein